MEAATADRVPLEGEDPDDRPEEEEQTELVVDLGGQLGFSVGGKKPSDGTFVLQGGEIMVSGQMQKGERCTLKIEARCAEVHFKDKLDGKTGEIASSTRKHVLKIEGAERV